MIGHAIPCLYFVTIALYSTLLYTPTPLFLLYFPFPFLISFLSPSHTHSYLHPPPPPPQQISYENTTASNSSIKLIVKDPPNSKVLWWGTNLKSSIRLGVGVRTHVLEIILQQTHSEYIQVLLVSC